MSFSEKLRIELNNLFLGIAIPCAIFYLVYNVLGPRRTISYIVSCSWVIIMLVPLYLNYRKKYTAAKLYSIIVPLIVVVVLHFMHGLEIRIEPAYLLLILISSFFFKKRSAIIMSSVVSAAYLTVIALLPFIDPPMVNKVSPVIPVVYYAFAAVSSFILVTKVLVENENFNKLTAIQNDTLEKKNKQLEKFAYIASHDLKTPIRNIVSFVGLVERNIKKEQFQQVDDDLEYIKSNALQMSALVEGILQISTLDYADHEAREIINLDQVVDQIKQVLINEYSDNNASIQHEILPLYYGNAAEFYLVFQNLIQNGLKYNKSTAPSVRIWPKATEEMLCIHVKDNGIGIEEMYYEQIFEFFKRLHTSSEYEGTGLGLGLCKRIIESYQGSITLQSELGKGSTFTINLPLNT